MRNDGNFVLLDAQKSARWSTDTSDHPDAYLKLQDDGNLVLFSSQDKKLWSTNTYSLGFFHIYILTSQNLY